MHGYRVPYEPETVSAKITEPAGENSRVFSRQQYFAGVYYGVILADAVVPVWSIVREARRGQYPVPPSAFLREGSIVLLEQITTIDKRLCRQHLGSFDTRQMDAIRRCIEISIGQDVPERVKLPRIAERKATTD